MKLLLTLCVFCAMLLVCLLPTAKALELSDTKEVARQIAASANDNALSIEQREEALKELEEALRLFQSVGESMEAARVLNRMGHLHLVLHRSHDAIDDHLKALALLKDEQSLDAEVDNLNGLAAAYLLIGDKEKAAEVIQKALMLSEQAGYAAGQAQALLMLSEQQNFDNHALALETAQKALKLWEILGDKAGLVRSYFQVGTCYLAQSMLAEATQSFQRSLDLSHELNSAPDQAEALISLGFIEHRKGEWQNAISYFTQAQGLLDEKAEPYKMGQIAASLAEAFNETGLPENGIIQYQRALDYFRQTDDPTTVAYATWGLGCTYYLLKNYTEALTYLRQSLVDVKPDSLYAASSYEYLGRVYIATGEDAAALLSLQSALTIYKRTVNPKETGRVLALIGQIHEQQGKVEQARQYYKDALSIFNRLSDSVNEATVYYALGKLELKSKNYDAAQDYLRQSVDATENIRRVSASSDLTTAFSATVHERYESYIECLMRKHEAQPEKGFDIQAFEMSELARARSLTELLHATQTNLAPGLDPQLAGQEKSLRQSLRVKENEKVALLGREYRREELAAIEAEIASLENQYKQVIETIRVRYPVYEQITRPVAWDLQHIQEQVVADDQTVLLEYSLGAETSYVWAITRHDMRSYSLPAQASITEAAQKVYELLSSPPLAETDSKLNQAAQELSRMILSPVATELNKSRLIVVADGALNYIPFQFLPSPSANGEQMVAGYEVVNTPSASILGQLQQETALRQTPPKILAAFGDPVFAASYAQRTDANVGDQVASMQKSETQLWQQAVRDIELKGDGFDPLLIRPLFYAKQELANLRDIAGEDTFIATGFDATNEKLKSTDLTQYAILHFATHGILDPQRPENSGLFLSMVNREGQAQNGFVGLRDIYGLHTPVDLVVLSACRTGLGKDVRGEGLIGLTRGFMYAGASSVVASLWKVDDEATAELMKHFYENMLQRRMTPAEALRAAQNRIRQQRQWRSPYYWAAFTLQGNYRRVIRRAPVAASPSYQKTVVGGALFAFVGGLGWLYYYHRSRYSTVKK